MTKKFQHWHYMLVEARQVASYKSESDPGYWNSGGLEIDYKLYTYKTRTEIIEKIGTPEEWAQYTRSRQPVIWKCLIWKECKERLTLPSNDQNMNPNWRKVE